MQDAKRVFVDLRSQPIVRLFPGWLGAVAMALAREKNSYLEVNPLTNMLRCEVLRGQREIDRLLLRLALDPMLAAAIAQCQRPYISSRPLREQGKTTFPVLTIACPDRETADVLHHAVPWGWYYLPFQGGCFGLCLEFPDGEYYFTPDDPRVLAFKAALPCLLSTAMVADLAVEYEAAPWVVRGTGGWHNAEPNELEQFPSLCLVCFNLETLNACCDRAKLLLNLAAALIPNLKRLTLLYWPDEKDPESTDILLDWERVEENWQCVVGQERSNLQPMATQAKSEPANFCIDSSSYSTSQIG